jgi:preprotein translocase subunit SecE
MGERKYVQLMYIVGFMIGAYVLVMTTDWVWGYFQKPDPIKIFSVGIGVAGLLTYLVWRHRPTQQSASETVAELRKVTWPTRKETSQATVVVIITVIIAAIFLQIFDAFWSRVTGYILG